MSYNDIDKCQDALIGLQYVKEYCDGGYYTYWCDLCNIACGSQVCDVVCHVITKHHRMNYMRAHFKSFLEAIHMSPFSEQNSLIVEYSRKIEKTEGRKSMVFVPTGMSSLDSSESQVFIPDEDLRTAAWGVEQQASSIVPPTLLSPQDLRLSDASNVGSVLQNIAERSGHKNVADLLKNFTKDLITNEEEAAKAFEVANVLTKTLLEYRLKTAQ